MGSSSIITNLDGEIVQHIEYVPFGEVFIEERNKVWNTPYLFNGKELDEETGLYYYGARYYNPRESVWLSVDPLVEQTMTPYQYTYQNPIRYTDPDGQKPTPTEAAAMAAHVYGDKKDDILIGGWEVSNKTFKNVTLEYDNSGFKSQIYERTVDGKTEYAYATAGTEDLIKDGSADLIQPFGASTQYSQSAANAKEISNQLGDDVELTFTGHSLGGGLAALNSNLTRREAITFNAAGVGKATKFKEGGITAMLRTEGLITAYIMTTDPLNAVQNKNRSWLGIPKIGSLMPDVNGKRKYIKPTHASSIYNGHSMDNMLKEFGIDPEKYAK